MSAIGLDIGGANLKVAHTDGICLSEPFPLWKEPAALPARLAGLLDRLPRANQLAVTMTGELADCFALKREGVAHIIDSVRQACDSREFGIWSTGEEFLPPEFAIEYPLLVASANWHALATWVGRIAPHGGAILIDIGSTTTDLIPLVDGHPASVGLTDVQRLQSGELEYSGVARTPLSSIAHSAPFRGSHCALAAEWFATTLDLYLWLGQLQEDPQNCDTANGEPATRDAARDRLCRMLCGDRNEITDADLDAICIFLKDVQQSRIRGALDRVIQRQPTPIGAAILSGQGEFLADEIVSDHPRLRDTTVLRLSSMFDPAVAASACAFAVARLAEERI